jgi:tetratricopeptide (TPR) repeat protein
VTRSVILIIALAAAAATARAAPRQLQEAQAAYEALKFERALGLLNQALSSPQFPARERAEIYLYIGLCRLQLGEEASARQAFDEALSLNPQASLPPLVSPKISRVFAEVAIGHHQQHRSGDPAEQAHEVQAAPVAEEAMAPPAGEAAEPGPGVGAVLSEHWPMLASFMAAAILSAGGVYYGMQARDASKRADAVPYAADGVAIADEAKREARTANILYGAAGGAAVLGAVFIVAF